TGNRMAVETSPAAGGTPGKEDASQADGALLPEHYILSPKNVVPSFAGRSAVIGVEVTDRRTAAEPLVAVICSPDMGPRVEAMTALRGLTKAGTLQLKDFGAVDWPDGKQRLAAIYNASRGGRFSLTAPMPPWQIIDALFRPVAQALVEIHGRAVVHRAIRP